jgi:DNA polymerase IV
MIACLLISDIVSPIEQKNPEASGKPVILMSATGHVRAASLEVVQAGVRVGMREQQAHTLYPAACLLPFDEVPYQELTEAIGDTLQAFTEKIELIPGFWKRGKQKKRNNPVFPSGATYYLDLGKLTRTDALFLADHIKTSLTNAFRLSCCLGLASGKFPAAVAVRFAKPDSPKLVRLGNEGRFLSRLSVNLLPLDKEISRHLPLLGITTLGAFAALPASAVFDRFGKQGRFLHQLAKGKDTRPVVARMPKRKEHFGKIFEGAIEDRTVLETILQMIGCEIEQRLEEKNLTAQSLQLALHLDDGKTVKTTRTLRDPTGNGKLIGRTLLRLLNPLELSSGVTEVDITAENLAPPVMQQLDLFGTPGLTENRLTDVLKNLTTRFGNEGIYHIEDGETDHWLPEYRFAFEQEEIEVA